jgi:transposase
LEPKSAILVALKSSVNRRLTMTYLTLSDDEWAQIRAVLPIPKRGPKRPHDRATCAAFLFAQAAAVSLESLPLGQFPDSRFLRTTWARWMRDGTLPRLFEVGAKAQARMEAAYDDHILRLTLDGERVTGKATTTLPRWTHVRGV